MRIQERFVGARDLSIDESDDLGAIAVFFDFENIVLGVKEGFRVANVISALNERGEVMIRRAYADWGRYRRHQRQFLESGVNMVFLPSYGVGDKNRTDTAICVDAMEILFQRPHIDTFVIVSGDSDFGVLAHRLRDHAKRIVGISAKSAASDILVRICHEFIFYETLVGQRVQGYSVEEGETRVKKALKAVVDQHGPKFRASVLKDRMRKQDPTFSEKNYGASSFTRFLSNYEHLVEVLDGGVLQVTWDSVTGKPQEREGGGSKQPPKLAPEMEAEARKVLTRSIREASGNGDSVSLSRLKDTMQDVAPDFDELGLGFRTFTRFLKAFPDIVVVERNRNRAHPADGVMEGAAEEPKPKREERKPQRKAEDERGERKAEPAEKKAEADKGTEKKAEDKESGSLSRAERRRIRAANRPKPPTPVTSGNEAEEAGQAEEAPKKKAAAKRPTSKKKTEPKADEPEEAPKKKSTASKSKPAAKKSTSKKAGAKEAEEAPKKKSTASKSKPAAKKSTSKKKAEAKEAEEAPKKKSASRKSTSKKSTASKSKPASKKSTASKSKPAAKKSTASKSKKSASKGDESEAGDA
ncbi:MAG: NYN domain-containing protein [Myxococcota bacterium]